MEDYSTYAILLVFVIAAIMMKIYSSIQAYNIKGLETIMGALEALGPLNGKLRVVAANPTLENKLAVRECIKATLYLDRKDAEFILDIGEKSDEEIKAFSDKIIELFFQYMVIRDRFQRKIYGRTIP